MRRRRTLLRRSEDSDPMSVVSNLFDVAMVFAVALMVALVSRYNMTEMFSQEDFTMVKNPGKENMEIIHLAVIPEFLLKLLLTLSRLSISEMICSFPYFYPYEIITREIREFF